MRTLNLTGSMPEDCILTVAIMYAPDDPEFQRSYFASHYALSKGWDAPGQNVIVRTELIRALIYGPSFSQMKVEVVDRVKRGTIAGYVLVAAFLMWKYPHLMGARKLGGVSLNKAFQACSYISRNDKWTYGDGTQLPVSETKIKQIWAQYKSAAHMWAAFAWNMSFPLVEQEKLLQPEGLNAFLGMSRYFEEFGKLQILDDKSSIGSKTVLDPATCTQMPLNIKAAICLPTTEEAIAAAFNESPLSRAFRNYAAS